MKRLLFIALAGISLTISPLLAASHTHTHKEINRKLDEILSIVKEGREEENRAHKKLMQQHAAEDVAHRKLSQEHMQRS